ncbi:MAG: hypothetical protein ABIW76_02850 [Fibrobacteria bacterium]
MDSTSHVRKKWAWLAAGFLLCVQGSRAAEFSKAEWDNPAQSGSSIWIRNGKAAPVRIKRLYVRDNGIHRYGEIGIKAGKKKLFFKVDSAKQGKWVKLKTQAPVVIRIRAKDSVLISGFQYGNRLRPRKKQAKHVAEQYVLDLKAIDDAGDSSVVKISQTGENYYIGASGGWPGSEQDKYRE